VLSLSFSDIQGQMILEGSLNGPIFFFMQKELNPKQMFVIKIRDKMIIELFTKDMSPAIR
jgi:hypothetical protein